MRRPPEHRAGMNRPPAPARTWNCPACAGSVGPAGPTERDGLVCERCAARYRHPRMALILSMVLPGLGSIYLRRTLRGVAALGFGSAAFLGTLARMATYLLAAYRGEPQSIAVFVRDAAIGNGLVIAAYAFDLALVWRDRGRLVPR